MELQDAGIDKQLLLFSGNTLNIDIKKRRKNYGDILLEEYSKYEQKELGWLDKPSKTDYILYYVEPINKIYWLPYFLLKKSWKKNKELWRESVPLCKIHNIKHICAKNPYWFTTNIPVPTELLLESIKDEMKKELHKTKQLSEFFQINKKENLDQQIETKKIDLRKFF